MEYPESSVVDAQSHLQENTLLRFRVGPFRFSVPAVEVEGIIVPPHLTVIPLNPPHSKGVFMYHQRLASAISLRSKFGLPDNDDENLGQLILGEVKTGLVGFWVDEVYETIDSAELEWREMPGFVPHEAFESFAVKDNDIVMASTMQKLYDVPAEEMASMLASVRQNFDLPADVPPVAAAGAVLGNLGDDEDAFGDLVESSRVEASVSAENKPTEENNPVVSGVSEPPSTVVDFTKSRASENSSNAKRSPAATSFKSGNAAQTVRPNSKGDNKSQGIPFSSQSPGMRGEARTSSYGAARTVEGTRATGYQSRSGSDRATSRPQSYSGGTYAGSIDRVQQEYTDTHTTAPGFIDRDSKEKRSGNGVGWLLLAVLFLIIGFGYWLWPSGGKKNEPTEIPRSTVTESYAVSIPEIAQNPEPVDSGSGSQVPQEVPGMQPTKIAGDRQAFASNKSDSGEVYRLEGKDVTVTVERSKPELRAEERSPEVSQPSGRVEVQARSGYREFVHIVVKGDTLWDIARKYLKNPFRYPELARLSEIKNPDLIYPGDTVRIRAREEK